MNTLYKSTIALVLLCMAAACSQDVLDPESVITIDNTEYNQFDKWLKRNYVDAYNIAFKYRYEEIEADYNYYTVPAKYENSVMMAHILKHTCLEAYEEVAGAGFVCAYFPKLVHCTGEWLYRNNGTILMASAEGGRKINLEGLNHLPEYLSSAKDLNSYYIKTIHHEFTHILNQTRNYPTDYQFVTGTDYVGGAWSDLPYSAESYYMAHGFISAYSQQEHSEDFAELLSIYVTTSKADWSSRMNLATAYTEEYNAANSTTLPNAAQFIEAKLDIIRSYMLESWGIDIDALRDGVQRRESEVINGKVDLMDISTESEGRE